MEADRFRGKKITLSIAQWMLRKHLCRFETWFGNIYFKYFSCFYDTLSKWNTCASCPKQYLDIRIDIYRRNGHSFETCKIYIELKYIEKYIERVIINFPIFFSIIQNSISITVKRLRWRTIGERNERYCIFQKKRHDPGDNLIAFDLYSIHRDRRYRFTCVFANQEILDYEFNYTLKI